jgi:glycerol-3-phosphate dehydrogenase
MGEYDLVIIGGGINGCGIARDAAGRGLSVLLVEQGDLASATSSASTKLIHGGLRYLEHYHFRLVRESLRERSLLRGLAPHLVRPMRFVMPHVPGMRSPRMLRMGFALYDWFGSSPEFPRTRALDLADDPAGAPLKPGFGLGFEFSDCLTDDARLTIVNAIGAREKGATIRTRTRCVAARREEDRWQLVLQSGGRRETIVARALVNAGGPWVARVVETVLRRRPRAHVRLVKGSHIVVPRLHAHERAYLLQNDDSRFVFAVPFAADYTLIGTTEVELPRDSTDAAASSEEILYLCRAASAFFRTQIKPSQVKWTFAGVRTLVDDGTRKPSEVTRDYWIDIDGNYGEPPLISIFGGKLTTYRSLADKVMDRLKPRFALGPAWTHREALPGGDLPALGLDGLIASLRTVHPYLSEPLARRLAGTYGTRVWTLLGEAKRIEDLGGRIAANLHKIELDYLRAQEWAMSADDVLWRRTKLGLAVNESEVEALHAAFATEPTTAKLAG